MSDKGQFIIKIINVLDLEHRYAISRILAFRQLSLIQNGNGAYIMIKDIDAETLDEIYVFLKNKLT